MAAAMARWQCKASAVTTQPFSRSHANQLHGGLDLVAVRRQHAGQCHRRLGAPGAHHDAGHMALAALVGTPRRLAVERHHAPAPLDLRARREGGHKPPERGLERHRVEHAKDARERIVAAMQLVGLLRLKGCVVTADALHCQRTMAAAIVARGGDYVLAVKGNQPGLARAAAAVLAAAGKDAKTARTSGKGHGRKETRTGFVAPAPDMAERHDFPGLAAVACVESRRGTDQPVRRTFLLSKRFAPERLLDIVRAHWTIENTLHWTLDVTLDEDLARNRKDNAPANLAVLRRLALNVARAHPDTKTSMRRKLLRAGWDQDFLFDLIRHMR